MDGLERILFLMPVFLLSLSVHEFAHGWVAFRHGDNTASQMGRLTLNPLAHMDLFGTLLLPAMGLYYQFPVFGWAKPVPVDPRNFERPFRSMALVAAAGPASNLILACFATVILAVVARFEFGIQNQVATFLVLMIQINIMLCVFNLLPLPPLDGFRIIQGFLSLKHNALLFKVERYGLFILLAIFFFGGLRFIAIPIQYLTQNLIQIALAGIT